jgi:hypothetical protein
MLMLSRLMESHGNQGPGLGQTHKYVEVKQVNGIPTLPPLDNWISNANTDTHKQLKPI